MKKMLLGLAALWICLFGCGALGEGAIGEGFIYEAVESGVSIIEYIGADVEVAAPQTLGSLPVVEISERCLWGEGIIRLSIPDGVRRLSAKSFTGKDLAYIDVDAQNPVYAQIDGVLFRKGDKALIQYPRGKTDEVYVIPDGIATIAEAAFGFNDYLERLVIPYSVEAVEPGNLLYSMEKLAYIEVEPDNPAFVEIDGVLVRLEDGALMVYPPARPGTAYAAPESVEVIEELALAYAKNLTTMEIPEGVTRMGYGAFLGAASLKSVSIPGSVAEVSRNAFLGCTKLKEVTLGEGVKRIGDSAFVQCGSLVTLAFPSTITDIGESAFLSCSGLTAIDLPQGLASIGASAFRGCTALKEVSLPASVETIGAAAFAGCGALAAFSVDEENERYQAVDGVLFDRSQASLIAYPQAKPASKYRVPQGTQRVDLDVFSDCPVLRRVTIPSSATEFEHSFAGEIGVEFYVYEGTAAQEYMESNGLAYTAWPLWLE